MITLGGTSKGEWIIDEVECIEINPIVVFVLSWGFWVVREKY